jgi:pyochelin biosynthesis protein PchC
MIGIFERYFLAMTAPTRVSTWLRRFHSAPAAKATLVCLPHGGGTASAYKSLSEALAPHVEVLAVQYPGRQDRFGDPMIGVMTEIAEAVAANLPPTGNRRVAVFGHSMGATVAYETARRIEQRGTDVAALFVSGRPSPAFVEPQTLHLQGDDALLADMRRLGGPDTKTIDLLVENPDLAEMVLPFVRSDYKAVETYRFQPGHTLKSPIVAMYSDADPTVNAEQAAEWSEFTSGTFETATFSGGHFYIDEQLPKVAAVIRSRLGVD